MDTGRLHWYFILFAFIWKGVSQGSGTRHIWKSVSKVSISSELMYPNCFLPPFLSILANKKTSAFETEWMINEAECRLQPPPRSLSTSSETSRASFSCCGADVSLRQRASQSVEDKRLYPCILFSPWGSNLTINHISYCSLFLCWCLGKDHFHAKI